jgi:dihydrofolate synthase/folylpolyglutamate synthase
LELLKDKIPVSMQAVRQGLMLVELPGRFQVLPGRPTIVLDVAHNPQAAGVLNENLSSQGFFPETWALLGMLADKDVAGVVERLRERVDHWLVASLPGPRGLTAGALTELLLQQGIDRAKIQSFPSVTEAWLWVRPQLTEADRLVVLGSFLTVAEVMQVLKPAR